jgi:hypothetical protein
LSNGEESVDDRNSLQPLWSGEASNSDTAEAA